jgi:hypothetical protein
MKYSTSESIITLHLLHLVLPLVYLVVVCLACLIEYVWLDVEAVGFCAPFRRTWLRICLESISFPGVLFGTRAFRKPGPCFNNLIVDHPSLPALPSHINFALQTFKCCAGRSHFYKENYLMKGEKYLE